MAKKTENIDPIPNETKQVTAESVIELFLQLPPNEITKLKLEFYFGERSKQLQKLLS